ncbi:MAG: galactose-1-epimerase, partial [Firmicutes bacterium]|nr:galactose-1-epimerase [Bacillota bacterium]
DHILQINADCITETDAGLIPTGRFLDVEGTRFDFRKPIPFEPGYDDNFVLRTGEKNAAVLKGKNSGIEMTVSTDQPGLQLYNTETHICLEAQHFADSPNRPEFPNTVLIQGEAYVQNTTYSFKRVK